MDISRIQDQFKYAGDPPVRTQPVPEKKLDKESKISMIAKQMDEDAENEVIKKKEAAAARSLRKSKPLFPFLAKGQKSREQILFQLWCGGGNTVLLRIMNFMDIISWSERRHWFFLWLDMGTKYVVLWC